MQRANAASPPRSRRLIDARPEDRQRERLGARDDAVEVEIFQRGMGIAANRADAANRWGADARGEAGICTSAGEFAVEVGQARVLRPGCSGAAP